MIKIKQVFLNPFNRFKVHIGLFILLCISFYINNTQYFTDLTFVDKVLYYTFLLGLVLEGIFFFYYIYKQTKI